jgi:hypothetical protein
MTDSKPSKAPASKAPAKAAAASKAPAKAPAKTPAKAPAAPKPPAAAVPPVPPTPPAPPAPQPYAQPYAQQNPYAAAPYQPNMGPRTNALAIVSLVSSLAGLVIPILAPIAGIITGHLAMGQIKRTGEAGHGLALAGTIIGYALTGLTLLVVLFYVIFFVALFGSTVLLPTNLT